MACTRQKIISAENTDLTDSQTASFIIKQPAPLPRGLKPKCYLTFYRGNFHQKQMWTEYRNPICKSVTF